MRECCSNHPEKEALSSCRSCGRFFCGDCLVEGKDYYYCFEESCQSEMHHKNDQFDKDEQKSGESVKLATVARYSHPYEAELARARLESEGILAFVADEFVVNLNWFYSNAIGGIRLQVPEPDVELARQILSSKGFQEESESKD